MSTKFGPLHLPQDQHKIQVMIGAQDLSQFVDWYEDKGAQALTSNLHTQITFVKNNPNTKKQFSKMLENQMLPKNAKDKK